MCCCKLTDKKGVFTPRTLDPTPRQYVNQVVRLKKIQRGVLGYLSRRQTHEHERPFISEAGLDLTIDHRAQRLLLGQNNAERSSCDHRCLLDEPYCRLHDLHWQQHPQQPDVLDPVSLARTSTAKVDSDLDELPREG
eukprot:m.90198 g.90198  ORF g.90198 m.90198 type:complete len:137 (+) comp14871_c0_seq33:2054-2464(+)